MKETSGNLNKLKIAAVIFFIIIGVLYFLIYVAPKVSDVFVEDYTAEYGTLDVDTGIQYLCVRNEALHTSDADGTVERTVKGGALIRKGAKVVAVNGYGYKTPERGIVSYYYDGLEKKYSSETIPELTSAALKPSTDEEGNSSYKLKKCADGDVKKGSAVYKIIDSHEWYLVTWLEPEEAAKFTEGQTVTIEMDDDEKTQLKFRVSHSQAPGSSEISDSDIGTDSEDDADTEDEAVSEDGLLQVVFSCDRYYEKEDRLRYGNARVITKKVTGIILETSSVTEEHGYKGVYVKNKYNEYMFTPIKVIAEVGDKTVAESRTFYDPDTDKIISTVKNYDSVKKGDGSGDVDQN